MMLRSHFFDDFLPQFLAQTDEYYVNCRNRFIDLIESGNFQEYVLAGIQICNRESAIMFMIGFGHDISSKVSMYCA